MRYFNAKKNYCNIFRNDDNNTNDYNNHYAHLTGITDKTRANPHYYNRDTVNPPKFLSQSLDTRHNKA